MPEVKKVDLTIKLSAIVQADGDQPAHTFAMGGFLKALNRFKATVYAGQFDGFNVQKSPIALSEEPDGQVGEVLMGYVMDVGETTQGDIKFSQEVQDEIVRACVKGTHVESHVESVIAARVVEEAAAAKAEPKGEMH